MTRFADNIESGLMGVTSAQSSRASVELTRTRRFTGGGNTTWTGFFPSGTQTIDMGVYILANGSAATSDRITLTTSAGATTIGTISSFGSSSGLLKSTTVALGTISMIASAAYQVGPSDSNSEIEVPFQVIVSSVDTATDYGFFMSFRRRLKSM